ncbi:MFS transporter [Neokomagataea thailandica]|uniref:Major facilitator superfamily transporter n=1 Tax=Neokomagataea tanensis NBRC 106556 TaxID=1223519 RepID=A0ABQ0QIX1_9PROT|nr:MULTISPECIES: MFS transporter [Neokomagataea]GBR46419.1 major facilitator superfamily transporter [Neokomagataea tanensis NBRC 106556]
MTTEDMPAASPTQRVLPVVLFNLLVYSVIGLPSTVLTLFVHEKLGYSTTIAGLSFSLQYLATFAGRAPAGKRIDLYGPKPVVTIGLLACMLSGISLFCAGFLQHTASLSLTVLLISRLFLGWAESWVATGVTVWNIGRVGSKHTATAISWNGVTSYGGIALGAPLGAKLAHLPTLYGSIIGVGFTAALLPLIGLILIKFYQGLAPAPAHTQRLPFSHALRLVFPHGMALATGSVGFGAISSFLALYYAHNHWNGAGLAVTTFGFVFVFIRLAFGKYINTYGGAEIAALSLLVEASGLALIGFIHSPLAAIAGSALTGAGFSLLFPSLGTLAVNRAGAHNRGAALGAYSLFTDLSVACCGLVLGQLIEATNYTTMFATTALCCLIGVGISRILKN